MNFLILLLLLVFILKFYQIYQKYEGFHGNCIKEFSPNFNDASGDSLYRTLKYAYSDKDVDSVEITNNIQTWKEYDLSTAKVISDISDYMQDPMSPDYPYFDNENCKLKYVKFNNFT